MKSGISKADMQPIWVGIQLNATKLFKIRFLGFSFLMDLQVEFFFFLNFLFRNNYRNHSRLQRSYRAVLHTLHPAFPPVISYLEYTIKNRKLVFVAVCAQFCVILSHVQIHVANTPTGIQNYSVATKISFILCCIVASVITDPWQPLIVCHFYHFDVSRMLCKQNHTTCDQMRLAVFTQRDALETLVHVNPFFFIAE